MFSKPAIPNLISIGRVILVLPVVWLLVTDAYETALILFLIAGISDGLDGFLAKRYGWESELGSMLDPLADKFLLVSAFLCLAWLGALDWWLVGLIILRDFIIVFGATFYYHRISHFVAHPSYVSKLNTLLQILLVLALVFQLAYQMLPLLLIHILYWSVVATTLVSGVAYILTWGRRAQQYRTHKDAGAKVYD